MDFRSFRREKTWITVPFEGAEFQVAYRPRELVDEDLEFLSRVREARLAEFSGIDATLGSVGSDESTPNRATRRAAAKSKEAVGPDAEKPTIIDYMKRLIVDWTLEWPENEADEDSPLVKMPVTEESFRKVEPALRLVFIMAIITDYLDRPNRMTSSPPSSEDEVVGGQTGLNSASMQSSGETAAVA